MVEELELEIQFDDIDEVSSQVEPISLEDLSFSLKVDESVANEAIIKTLVGCFLAKKPVSSSLLRVVMGKVWWRRVSWKMQEKSGDLNTTPIWVQDYGFPLNYITEQNAEKIVKCFSKFLEINQIQQNDMMLRDHLRFKVDISLNSPIQAGFSLSRANAPKTRGASLSINQAGSGTIEEGTGTGSSTDLETYRIPEENPAPDGKTQTMVTHVNPGITNTNASTTNDSRASPNDETVVQESNVS
ncbi:hypothetical protein PanWU01x14_076110 [Parasponia andersonii]|uniref:DUF4283 domain-containing protein n=1 Tax=Parasponia andersonii TaxID=3476 RepID=A0A2P5DD02_PARAD|nr:hypothetical protein PanWU01x14_076110 [Parasponia andersonii]